MGTRPKFALISTVYNEGESILGWIEALAAQTIHPDEFVIVDGGSVDETVRFLRDGFARTSFPAPRIIIQRCNIAEGRNIAIRHCTAPLLASLDAGSVPDPKWLEQLIEGFITHPHADVVGGYCPNVLRNDFQRKIDLLITPHEPVSNESFSPSSRNVAFTRAAWEAVGGYPQWLTLTAEDALFNLNLHAAGFHFHYQPSARVSWESRPNLKSYLKMMKSYGYGSAEIGMRSDMYWRWLISALIPPIILFSRKPVSYLGLRYLRNAAAAWGWVLGNLKGHRPPAGWQRINGTWLSPETIATRQRQSG